MQLFPLHTRRLIWNPSPDRANRVLNNLYIRKIEREKERCNVPQDLVHSSQAPHGPHWFDETRRAALAAAAHGLTISGVQISSCLSAPTHTRPLNCGSGLVHDLVRTRVYTMCAAFDCCCSAHDACVRQADHCDHSVQPPLTSHSPISSDCDSSHDLPPLRGSGWVHVRVRHLHFVPDFVVHVHQADHALKPPSTLVYSIFIKLFNNCLNGLDLWMIKIVVMFYYVKFGGFKWKSNQLIKTGQKIKILRSFLSLKSLRS